MKKMLTASLSILSLILVSANAHADQPDCGATFGECYASTLKEIQQLNAKLEKIKTDQDSKIKQMAIPIASVLAFSGDKTTVPDGWMLCDGRELSAATYPELFAVIKNIYGTANVGSFKLPDYRGMFLRGTDNGAGKDPDATKRIAMDDGANSGDSVGSLEMHSLNKEAFSDFRAGLYTINNVAAKPGTYLSAADSVLSTDEIPLFKTLDLNWENWETDYRTKTCPKDPTNECYYPNPLFGAPYHHANNIENNFNNVQIFNHFSPSHFTTETRPTNMSVNYIIYAGKQVQNN